jgi:hypothetical protein
VARLFLCLSILLAALNPIMGYPQAAEIARKDCQQVRPVMDVAVEHTDLTRSQLEVLRVPGNSPQVACNHRYCFGCTPWSTGNARSKGLVACFMPGEFVDARETSLLALAAGEMLMGFCLIMVMDSALA